MKVYVVKQWNMCECEPPCSTFCVGYNIDDIYFDKGKADVRAEELCDAFVDEYTIKED